jgi:N-dimethylarginine dimethylaminohydrolase
VVCKSVIAADDWQRLVDRFGVESMVEVSEVEICTYATNGLPIGRDLIVPHLTPTRVRSAVERLGMNIVELSMTELCEKAGGASRCLVSHVSIEGEVEVPVTYRRPGRP